MDTNAWPPPEPPAHRDLKKISEVRRLSLEVGAGLNYVRPRAKPYYCYRRFKKNMGQRKEEEEVELRYGGSWSEGEGSSGTLFCQSESESGDLPSMGGESETERRRESMSIPTPPIWNSEMHLYLWERARVYIESYRRNSTMVVHPAVLAEDNIRELLYSEESWREGTPLSLNIYLAISLGAHAEGEKQTWIEFWMKFRNELGLLFDETDYNVAIALFLMGCHCFVANNEREKGIYYIMISQTICRRMGYLNSDAYLRGLGFLTFQARKKELSVKSLRRLQEKMVELNTLPYYYIPLHGNAKLHRISNATVEQAPTGDPSEYLNEQDYNMQEIHNLISKILVNVATGFALVKLRQQQKNQELQEEGSSGEHVNSPPTKVSAKESLIKYDVDGDEINQNFTGELIAKLVALNSELEEKKSAKAAYIHWARAFAASLTAEVFWGLGQVNKALSMALIFLRVIQSPGFAHTSSTMPVMCLPALTVLLGTQNFILLEEVLRTLGPMKTRFLPLETLLRPFEEKLRLYKRENYKFLREQDQGGEEEEEQGSFRFFDSSSSSRSGFGNFMDRSTEGVG